MKRILPLVLLLFTACQAKIPAPEPDRMVVEAWIEDGAAPIVLLSTTLAPSAQDQPYSVLMDHVIRYATVRLSDGEEEVVLMGRSDKDYLPPYSYTTGRMIGEAGKTYTLTIDAGDYHARAVATIPEPVALDDIRPAPAVTFGEGRYVLRARFHDAPDEHNYYKFFTKVHGVDSSFVSASMGLVDDILLNGQEVEMDVFPSTSILRESRKQYFESGERVSVKFSTITEEGFRIWKRLDELNTLANNPFFGYDDNLEGNVDGAIGFFLGYGSTKYTVEIP